ncbi:MAG TPA: hypothetical protein DDW52_22250 [Planctomycetaceae bacterium]|nr:hypothetical protein [Planctomycetaceae bacterium]
MNSQVHRVLLSTVIVLGAIQAKALADTIEIDTFVGGGQVGAYYGPYRPEDDPPDSYPAVPAPDISPSFQNYFMGRTTVSGFTTSERRPFFLFDTTSLASSIPSGHIITDLSISLELLPGGTSALANFAVGDKEVVEFTSTPFSNEELLKPEDFSIPFETIWDTLGKSKPYGGFEILGPSHPEPSMTGTHEISLAGGIEDLEDALASGEFFAVSARLETFDPGPIGKGATPVDAYEYVFGGTDVVTDSGMGTAPKLTITTSAVPEPSANLVLLGMLALVLRKRRC